MTDKLTQKGLFERLVKLETKLDLMSETNHRTEKRFIKFAFFIAIVEIFNFFLNYLIIAEHMKLENLLK